MSLPPAFVAALDKAESFHILDMSEPEIRARLERAVSGATAIEPGPVQDLGIRDFLRNAEVAVHKELCDPEKKALRDKYVSLLDKGTSKEGTAAIASIVLPILASINPAFAAPSLVILLSVWLLKVGLNHWCSLPAPGSR